MAEETGMTVRAWGPVWMVILLAGGCSAPSDAPTPASESAPPEAAPVGEATPAPPVTAEARDRLFALLE